jgi:hypothetical protein
MSESQSPWIEIRHSSIDKECPWQALFACQIRVRSYEERLKLKWGFSPAFLLEEALDRQKLFIETQRSNNPIDNQTEQRSLTLRCICVPQLGLLLGLVGKVLAESQEKAQSLALSYLRELESTFPYDYTIRPATSVGEFNRLTGREIFKKCKNQTAIAEIRRFESPVPTTKTTLRIVGLWQTAMRSDEQIWRVLARYPREVMLNISICPTTLYEGERRALVEMRQSARQAQDVSSDEPYLQNYESWIDPFINRFLSPWNKYFYLQVHLVSSSEIDEFLLRSIGSAITRDNPELSTPGFQIVRPKNGNEAAEWGSRLDSLERIHTSNNFILPRLNELASVEEAHAVFRLPYPPETGLPNVVFLDN